MKSTYQFEPLIPSNDWKPVFEKQKDTLKQVWSSIRSQSEVYGHGLRIYPPSDKVYRAFSLCDWSQVKVVVIGQDCYHGANQANGLCFSVDEQVPAPPSLQNILKEMAKDGISRSEAASDFSGLAKQGVLLLNTALTVFEKLPESMLEYWTPFTDWIVQQLSKEKTNLVFILWGNFAKNKAKWIDSSKHCILTGAHPSPLSANRGGFFDGHYFSNANNYLISKGIQPIDWTV